VLAQEVGSISDTSVQRVEITGSSIKRITKEGALPVQIISAEQISKQGITSAEQLLSTISANGTGADNMTSGNNVFGADSDRVSGGASYASLRGLGPNHTLVLINGRRMPTFGASGKAVDLNSIPMAAVSRVEVLKDGASAIYGTDAIGGVINFILKQNYQGLEATINDNFTQEGGGATRRTTILAGHGDLQTDKYNLMASVTVDHNDELSSHQRSFANGFQPSRGLSPDTTGTPYANQLTGAGTALGTSFQLPGDPNKYLQAGLLSLQGKCNSYPGMDQYQTSLWKDVTSPLRSTHSCAYDYGADYVMTMPVERTNFVARGVFQLAPDHRMNVEFLGSNTKATAILTPEQISTGLATTVTLNDGSKTVINSAYPVNGPYYQNLQPYISTFDPTKPIAYKWRADPFGNRTQQNDTNSGRLLVSFEGTIAGKWDYKQGFSYAASKTHTDLTDGYVLSIPMYQALGTGVINPWAAPGQAQSAAAQAAINSFEYRGALQHGKTSLTQIDGSLSGEVYQLPAGPLAMAVGYEYRRESYGFQQDVDASTILLAPGNGNQPTVFRNVAAVYAEAIVPVTKQLEAQLAIRTDQYSVIGRTTDPKIAFRYQPTQWLLFRGSANKGFLAPSFTQLYSGQLLEELPNGIIDPIGCPTHPGNPAYCAIDRQNYYSGGNPNLKPETSKQGTLGVVIEPFKGYSASFDWWAINTKNAILNRTPQIVLANAAALSSDIVRNPDGTINYIQAGWINAGGVKTRGVDVALRGEGSLYGYKWSATLDGTYTQSYKYQEIAGEPYLEEAGNFYTRDLYLRWKHNATLNVGRGNWSGTLSQRYASGYKDELPDAGISAPPAGFNPDVHSYTTYALYGTYTGIKNATITVGIQNLLNTDPPFTAHNVDEVVGAGWDPRVADPRGRAISFEVKYKFF
jgi:iron complex outermembrane receptor protein